ncbi:MAG TPA: helix-turn-helix domain-containing protein [Streptosporangiaceae bacterium]|nr:helix-turn-helix domain-containing protein [Streptosporangiaceae bacterium]
MTTGTQRPGGRGARARELADLLRSRRDRLQPADVGLPAGQRRRTKGLRREEVAQLAGVSTTYYTFLEQGRDLRPSWEVLEAISRALRLGPAERAHVHTLGSGTPKSPVSQALETLAPAVSELVDRMDPYPAYVTGRYWDVLASNRAARLLWTDWPALPAAERNMLWWTFTDPAARSVLVDWEPEAQALLARFRAAAGEHPEDPGFAALIERLRNASPEFRASWPRHEVAPLSSGSKRLRHPALGEVTVTHVVLTLADNPEQKLVTFAASEQDQQKIEALLADAADAGLGWLAGYRPRTADEAADAARIRTLVRSLSDPWSRSLPLHLTASALIVDPPSRRVLLRWHQRQQAWLQVGGHGDPGERDALAIALREAAEETGLTDLVPWPDASVRQVVIVSVPAAPDEPAHEHADIRFVLATGDPAAIRPETPDAPLRWLTVPVAKELTSEDNLRGLLATVGELFTG